MIETERLRLREFDEGDAAFALALLNEPAFLENIGDRGVRTLADAERYIESGPRASYQRHGFGHYVVVLKATGVPIGICGLRTRAGLEHPDLGYALLHDYWGHGYALEAARAVLAHAIRELGLPCITAICSPGNKPSISVLARLHFVPAGRTRLPGENHDVLRFEFWPGIRNDPSAEVGNE